ncbi:Eukaryotic translation initiation factor 2-alpha kinase 3, variant 2 [Dermatophagoides farinae]|uniref:Eukaryotic translation initiation factor 2-alpha kinase 3, variant 2 n=1 Tax=Dermatophagoides farinae TaxID=6954 RepID=A0A922I9P0_DERFA|nr:Eukaryotic translation initiation factor 2-alpha kinase 3, variant 2 [Dermatophagoides farinae]
MTVHSNYIILVIYCSALFMFYFSLIKHQFFRLSGVATDWLCLTTMEWLIQSTPQECRNLQN